MFLMFDIPDVFDQADECRRLNVCLLRAEYRFGGSDYSYRAGLHPGMTHQGVKSIVEYGRTRHADCQSGRDWCESIHWTLLGQFYAK